MSNGFFLGDGVLDPMAEPCSQRSEMNPILFLIAQMGSKSARTSSVQMLLDRTDLPEENWEVASTQSWRTGFMGVFTEEKRRARRVGTFTAVRFLKRDAPFRSMFVQVMPFASQDDAVSSVPKLGDMMPPNPQSRTIKAGEVHGRSVDFLENPWTYEGHTERDGVSHVQKVLGGNVSHVVFIVSCTGANEGCNWNEVISYGSLQYRKIERLLGESS